MEETMINQVNNNNQVNNENNENNEYYIKKNVSHREYFMQHFVYKLNIINVPEIINYNDDTRTMTMVRVGKNNLSHNYGENATDISDDIFDKVAVIVRKLVLHGIEFPDLTGYNFVEDDTGKIWIIDFEHAKFTPTQNITNIHIRTICNGTKRWNPDFK